MTVPLAKLESLAQNQSPTEFPHDAGSQDQSLLSPDQPVGSNLSSPMTHQQNLDSTQDTPVPYRPISGSTVSEKHPSVPEPECNAHRLELPRGVQDPIEPAPDNNSEITVSALTGTYQSPIPSEQFAMQLPGTSPEDRRLIRGTSIQPLGVEPSPEQLTGLPPRSNASASAAKAAYAPTQAPGLDASRSESYLDDQTLWDILNEDNTVNMDEIFQAQ